MEQGKGDLWAVESKINYDKARVLNRPITGIIHKDRIWEQWYSEDALRKEFPKMNQRDFLFACNKEYPNQIMLNYRGKKKYTVNQFEEIVDKFSNILFYGYGVKKGDIICTIALSTIELVALKYACATIGAITCNLNFLDAKEMDGEKNKLEAELELIQPKLLFTLDILESKVSGIVNKSIFTNIKKIRIPVGVSPIENLKVSILMQKNKRGQLTVKNTDTYKIFLSKYQSNQPPIESVYEPEMPCNIAFTSGTTGINKAVLLTHDANNALAFQEIVGSFGFSRGAKTLTLIPPFLAIWDAVMTHAVLCQGAEDIFEMDLSYESIPKYMTKHLPQVGCWSQYLWDSILHLSDKELALVSKHLLYPIVGGERSEVNQVDTFYKKTGRIQWVGYGATEVDTTFTMSHPNCNVIGSAGIPLPHNNIKIVDENFRDLTYNEAGRLLITGPCLMLKYFNRDVLTSQALYTDDEGTVWYDTKDYAYVDGNGCLFVLDRDTPPAKISVGDKMETVKLLDIVEKIKVNRCIKICKLTCYKGFTVLHTVIDEFQELQGDAALESIKETITENLPQKYQPNAISILKTLPRTAVGKVDYVKLEEETRRLYEIENQKG